MNQETQRELDELIETCLNSIQKIVHDEQDFLPYVITNNMEGKGQVLTVDPSLDEEQALTGIYSILGKQAMSGELKSFGVVMDVKMTDKDTGEQVDAIRVAIEHRHADPIQLVIPYLKTEKGKQYREMQKAPSRAFVFRQEGEEAPSSGNEEQQGRALIEQIPQYAELHVQKAKEMANIELLFDESCFAQTDRIIEEGWGGQPPKMIAVVVLTFGSFIGEAIRRLHGGEWEFDDEHGVFLRDVGEKKIPVFPFDKVRKRFLNGAADSIGEYYENLKKNLVN